MNLVAATTRRLALIAVATAIAGAGILTAGCSSTAQQPPAPSATSSAPSVEPTEKGGGAPAPSFSDRGGMDSVTCGPGATKVNGICVKA